MVKRYVIYKCKFAFMVNDRLTHFYGFKLVHHAKIYNLF